MINNLESQSKSELIKTVEIHLEEYQKLLAEKAEYERLHANLNEILHPNGDGPKSPSLCDLISYVRVDIAKIAELEKERNALFHVLNAFLENNNVRNTMISEGVITNRNLHNNSSGLFKNGDTLYEYAPWFMRLVKSGYDQAKQLRAEVQP